MGRTLSFPAAVLAFLLFSFPMPAKAESGYRPVSAAISAMAEVVFPLGVVSTDPFPVDYRDLGDKDAASGRLLLFTPSAEVYIQLLMKTDGGPAASSDTWYADDGGGEWHGIDISELVAVDFGATPEICITVISINN